MAAQCYESYATTHDASLSRAQFRLYHYAGAVTYDASTFIFKNKDTLYEDLTEGLDSV